jgi:uncharacterized SAM-binding protein YcdF (DUF218 family)
MVGMRKWLLRIGLILFALVLLLGVAAFVFPQNFLCVDSGPVNADVVVVLGGGSRDRPERAAELFQGHAAPRILVSGQGDCKINRRLLIESGVPGPVVQLEDQSRTTRENAIFTVKLLRQQHAHRVIIVTSWYHSRRALACFEHYGPEIQFFSRPSYFAQSRADQVRNKLTHRIYLEYPKLFGYWTCYGIPPF